MCNLRIGVVEELGLVVGNEGGMGGEAEGFGAVALDEVVGGEVF